MFGKAAINFIWRHAISSPCLTDFIFLVFCQIRNKWSVQVLLRCFWQLKTRAEFLVLSHFVTGISCVPSVPKCTVPSMRPQPSCPNSKVRPQVRPQIQKNIPFSSGWLPFGNIRPWWPNNLIPFFGVGLWPGLNAVSYVTVPKSSPQR